MVHQVKVDHIVNGIHMHVYRYKLVPQGLKLKA